MTTERSTAGVRRMRLQFEGLTPYLMHSTVWLVSPPKDKPSGAQAGDWEAEHFRELCYTAEGTTDLIIPAQNVRKCLIDAARFMVQKPKGGRSWGPIVEAALLVERDVALGATVDKVLQHRAVVSLNPGQKNGGKGVRTRPVLPLPWGGETEITVIDPRLTVAVIADLADAAGRLVGFGEGRRIGFCRAQLTVTEIA